MRVFESGNIVDCFECGDKSTHYIMTNTFLRSTKRYFCKKCWLKEMQKYDENGRRKK